MHWLQVKDRIVLIRWSGCFFAFISLLFIVLGLRYLLIYSLPQEPLGLFYTFAAFLSQFFLLGYIPWLIIILPLSIVIPVRKLIFPLNIFIASFALSILLLDSLVFVENRFHFNGLTIRILGFKTWGFGIFYLFIFIAFTSLLGKWVWKVFIERNKRLPWLIIFVTIVILHLATHVLHIWADANYYTPITRFTSYLPFFYPTTAKRYMIKHGFANLEKSRDEQLMKGLTDEYKGVLQYPLKPLTFHPVDTLKNVVIIVIDDMRADVLKKDLSSRIANFADSSVVFENHFSGGNSTRMGIFSLFYGLPSTYWQYFESLKRSPVLMDAFMENRYQLGIFSSSPLYAPANIDCTVFSRVRNLRMKTEIPGKKRAYANDSAITDEWREWLDERDTADLFFGFLFYDAICSKSIPPFYEHMVKEDHDDSKMEKRIKKYNASLHYVDSLVGIVLEDLQLRNLSDETIVMITSDHGEEFDENKLGFKGHGSAYSKYQLHVPLVVKWPDMKQCRVRKRTSHNDISATLMNDLFGCKNPPSDYCSGSGLFSDKEWGWLIAGSYYNFAVVEPGQVTVQYPGGFYEMRDNDYRIIVKPRLNRKTLTLAYNEVGRFFKK